MNDEFDSDEIPEEGDFAILEENSNPRPHELVKLESLIEIPKSIKSL